MAFKAERVSQTIAGTKRIEVWSWDADGVTSGTIETGLSSIEHVSLNNQVSAGAGIAIQDGAEVDLAGLTEDDTGTLFIFGY